ncbi:hypothetical protein, partial [Lentibacillus salinarum]
NIPSLSPANGITVDYMEGSEYSYFGGIITDKEIKKVQVSQQNKKVHKANIFKMEDDISGWYSIFENDKGDSEDNPDNMKIQALDNDGVILWQKSYLVED